MPLVSKDSEESPAAALISWAYDVTATTPLISMCPVPAYNKNCLATRQPTCVPALHLSSCKLPSSSRPATNRSKYPVAVRLNRRTTFLPACSTCLPIRSPKSGTRKLTAAQQRPRKSNTSRSLAQCRSSLDATVNVNTRRSIQLEESKQLFAGALACLLACLVAAVWPTDIAKNVQNLILHYYRDY